MFLDKFLNKSIPVIGQPKKTPAENYVELASQVDLLFKQIAAICLIQGIKPETIIKQFYKDEDVGKFLAECIGAEKFLIDQEKAEKQNAVPGQNKVSN